MDCPVMILTPIWDLVTHNLHKSCFLTEIRVDQASVVVLDMNNMNEYTSDRKRSLLQKWKKKSQDVSPCMINMKWWIVIEFLKFKGQW